MLFFQPHQALLFYRSSETFLQQSLIFVFNSKRCFGKNTDISAIANLDPEVDK